MLCSRIYGGGLLLLEFSCGPRFAWGAMWLVSWDTALNLSRLSAPWTETGPRRDPADATGGWGPDIGAHRNEMASHTLLISSVMYRKKGAVHMPPKCHFISSPFSAWTMKRAFWPLVKGAQLLSGSERRILWMTWLMDTEMGAGREEGDACGRIKNAWAFCAKLSFHWWRCVQWKKRVYLL